MLVITSQKSVEQEEQRIWNPSKTIRIRRIGNIILYIILEFKTITDIIEPGFLQSHQNQGLALL